MILTEEEVVKMKMLNRLLTIVAFTLVAFPMLAGWPLSSYDQNAKPAKPEAKVSVKIYQRKLNFSEDWRQRLERKGITYRAVDYHVVATYPSRKTVTYGFGTVHLLDDEFLSSEDLAGDGGEAVVEYEMTSDDFLSAKKEMEALLKQSRPQIHITQNVNVEEITNIIKEYNTICQEYVNQQISIFESQPSVTINQNYISPEGNAGDSMVRETGKTSDSAESAVNGFGDRLLSGIDNLSASIKDAVNSLEDFIASEVDRIIDSIKNAINDFISRIIETVKNFFNREDVQQFIKSFIIGIVSLIILLVFIVIL